MAKIVHSDLAPDEVVHYDLAGVEFELGGSGKSSFETENRVVLGSAEVHPWLNVEYPKVDVIAGKPRTTLADHPELDPLSGFGPDAGVPYDADAIKAIEESKAAAYVNPLAIDANLDQSEAVTVGEGGAQPVDVTLAADEDHEPAKSAKAFHQDEETAAKAAAGELDPAAQNDPMKPASRSTAKADKEKS